MRRTRAKKLRQGAERKKLVGKELRDRKHEEKEERKFQVLIYTVAPCLRVLGWKRSNIFKCWFSAI